MQFKETQFYTRALIEENSDALIVTNPLGLIIDVNHEMEKMSGYGRDSLVNTQLKYYFREPARAEDGIRRVLNDQKISDYELIFVAKEGAEIIVSLNGSVFHDQDKKIQGVVYTVRDVSAQRKWEHVIQESQRYNRGLLEASVDGLVTVNPSMVITDVNNTMCRMTGYTSEELIGSVFVKYFTDSKRASDGVLLTLKNGVTKNYELMLCEKNGKQTPVSFNASVYYDNENKTAGIFASARDITEQQDLQKQLLEQQAYNRSIIEANMDALITIDVLGNITDVNKQMEHLSGYARDELIGSRFKEYFTSQAQAEAGFKKALEEGKLLNYELIIKAKNGGETVVSYNATTYFSSDGKLRGILASARDVTVAKLTENNLKKTLKNLTTSNAELQLILHITSHDLQEPLRMVSSFTQLLEQRYKDKLSVEAKEFIAYAVEGAKRAESQLNDLITYLEVTTYTEKIVSIDCNVLLKSVLEGMKGQIESCGAKITWTNLPQLNVDVKHFGYIFQNLIQNSIKFNEKTPIVDISVIDKDKYWLFSVKDNGIGIEPKYFDKLFIVFQRLNARDKYPGNGIGLAICKKVIEQAGGKIWVESKLGEGSTFYFTITKNNQTPQVGTQ